MLSKLTLILIVLCPAFSAAISLLDSRVVRLTNLAFADAVNTVTLRASAWSFYYVSITDSTYALGASLSSGAGSVTLSAVPSGIVAGDYIQIGNSPTYLKVSDAQSENLQEGSGKCALSPKTKYSISGFPGFEGENIKVTLKDPLPGCSFTQGYVFMAHVDATSAGGASELPAAVRAFLDTLAFSEGTTDHYNYIFSFATFKSYADHPRKVKCIGRLCSNAAGRYQFLSDTWDPLASALGLKDFTPPSQDKAVIELIRRDGTYSYVAGSAAYKNFTKAVYRLNNIWASLPGSPYGQPTHSMASLWSYYKVALAKYK